jgi:hypothetical protein
MPDNLTIRQNCLRRWGALKTERASWWAHYQEITSYLLPYNGRYFRQDRNKGWRRNNNIYDSTATRALRTLGAGMMAGATSPARPWFRLSSSDQDLDRYQPVKVWLDDIAKAMNTVFQKSNTYRALHQVYEELGAFGTAATLVLPDYQNVIHHYPVTTGEYCIAADAKGQVCTLYREFEMSVSAIVKEFGIKNCSTTVKNLYEKGTGLDQWIPIMHAIEPRADRDPGKLNAKNMPWASYYFEVSSDSDTLLRESGYKNFCGLIPRWAVAGGDIYGNGPGMEALGDIKQLQHEQLRKANAIDFQSNPPLQVPVELKNKEIDLLPGGTTYYTMGAQVAPIKSLFEVNLNLQYLLEDIQDCRERIRGAFFADLFMMISEAGDAGSRMTATEVAQRQEEKMLMLGPVLERLNNELLYPLIENTFIHMMEANAIPPAPQEMNGKELSVEFISVFAQAQKAIGTNSSDRLVGSLGVVAQMKQDVLDKFDADAWIDSYSDQLGVDPRIIIASDKVAVIRQQRSAAQAAQQQTAMQEQQSKTTKNLAQAPVGQNNALDLMNQFSGYGSPSPAQPLPPA